MTGHSGYVGPSSGMGFLLALCLSICVPSLAATLPDVVQQVLQQHPDIRSGQSLLKAADEVVAQQRSAYYPTLGITSVASTGVDEQYGIPLDRTTQTTDANLRWNLFHGLADTHAVRAAEYARSAADADLAETQESVALDVTEAYLDVLRLRQMLVVGDAYIADLERLSDLVERRVKTGRVPLADSAQMLVSQIQAEHQQSQLKSQLRGTERRYRLLAGADPGELTEPALGEVLKDTGLANLLDELVTGNGRMRADRERAMARGEEVGVANAALSPSLDLQITRRLQSNINPVSVTDTRKNTQFQISYQIPLGGGLASRKRQAVQMEQAAMATADASQLRARTDLEQRWETYREMRNIAPRLAERLSASDQVMQAYDLQFDSGRRSLLDLVTVRSERYQAQMDLIANHLSQLDAGARLLSLVGRLRLVLAQGQHAVVEGEKGLSQSQLAQHALARAITGRAGDAHRPVGEGGETPAVTPTSVHKRMAMCWPWKNGARPGNDRT